MFLSEMLFRVAQQQVRAGRGTTKKKGPNRKVGEVNVGNLKRIPNKIRKRFTMAAR